MKYQVRNKNDMGEELRVISTDYVLRVAHYMFDVMTSRLVWDKNFTWKGGPTEV